MHRLKHEDIFQSGAQPIVEKIDFDDPKNAHIKELVEQTREEQKRILELKNLDPSIWDLRMTI